MPDFRPIRNALLGTAVRWPCPPLMSGRWREVPANVVAALLSQSARDEIKGAEPLPSPILRMRALELSFYPDHFLVEGLASYDEERLGSFTMLFGPDEYRLLNGNSVIIHETNVRHLKLDGRKDRADQYLRFFAGAIQGELGPFRIIERVGDIEPYLRISNEARPKLGELIRPIKRLRSRDGAFRRTATVLYDKTLFATTFSIEAGGMVKMDGDEPLFENFVAEAPTYDGPWRAPAGRAGPQQKRKKGE